MIRWTCACRRVGWWTIVVTLQMQSAELHMLHLPVIAHGVFLFS